MSKEVRFVNTHIVKGNLGNDALMGIEATGRGCMRREKHRAECRDRLLTAFPLFLFTLWDRAFCP